jgi:hypothetical protein
MVLPEKFKVYKKEVKINIMGKEESFELLPLSGSFYSDFLILFRKGGSSEVDIDPSLSDEDKAHKRGEAFFDSLTKEDLETYHKLLLETFASSYDAKPADLKELDLFVSANLISLIPVLVTVNLPN